MIILLYTQNTLCISQVNSLAGKLTSESVHYTVATVSSNHKFQFQFCTASLQILMSVALNRGLGPCAQMCTNTIGSFFCSCQTGYIVSGYDCSGKALLLHGQIKLFWDVVVLIENITLLVGY